jgi:hypothetical protein
VSDYYQAYIARLERQLELSSQAWKAWEDTLREKDHEIAQLKAERDAYKRNNQMVAHVIQDMKRQLDEALKK